MDQSSNLVRLPAPSLSRLGFLVGTVAYIGVLYVSYVYLISPTFGYLGAVYRPEGLRSLLVASTLALVPALWMPVRLRRPSQVIYVLLYLMVMIPTVLVGAFTGTFSPLGLLMFGGVLVTVFGLLRGVYEVPLVNVSKMVETSPGFWLVFLAIGGVLYLVLFAKYGFSIQIPSLSEVYAQRAEFRRTVTGIGAYAFFWLAKAINPFLLAKGYLDRNVYLFAGGIAGQLLLFSMSGLRSVLFSFLLLGAILIALWEGGRYFGIWVVWGLFGLVGAVSILDLYIGFNLLSGLFVRRLLVVPGLNTAFYFDFFSANPHVYLGHSILDWLVQYPYESRPAMVIGNAYYGHLDTPIAMSANANLWADGYANFGILGILFFTALLAGVFWIADSLSLGTSTKLPALMLAYPAYMLANTKLQTTLLTHGLALVLLNLYLLPPQDDTEGRG